MTACRIDAECGRARSAAGRCLSRALPLLLASLAVGCGGERDGAGAAGASAMAIPDPSTDEMLAPAAAAIDDARTALVRAPASADLWGRYAMVLDAHKLYEPAAIAYARAAELAPADFRWAYLAAVVEDFRGVDAQVVVAAFERALALNEVFPPAWVRFGDALVRQGEDARARDAYARAVELDPDFQIARRSLGQVLLALGEPEQARAELERAVDLDPADGVALAALAPALRATGDLEGAREAAQRSTSLERVLGLPDPLRHEVDQLARTPPALRKRALAALAEGRFAEALPDFELLSALNPDDPWMHLRAGLCLYGTGDATAGRARLERALELDPTLAQARAKLAAEAEARGDFSAALAHYDAALSVHPDDARLCSERALCAAKKGDTSDALRGFARAAELGRDDAELFHNWGTTLLQAGQLEPAVVRLQSALARGPENAGTLYNLGLALEALGRTDEARRALERAAELDPNGPAAAHLARARPR